MDPGTVVVTITPESTGVPLVTGAATAGTGTAARTYTLTPAQTALLDRLTARWTSTTYPTMIPVDTYAEVVGAHLFEVGEARTFDKLQLASSATYPDAAIIAARDRIADDFERICCVSFIPRYARETLAGWALADLLLPHSHILAVRRVETRVGATWTAYTTDELADVFVDGAGILTRETLGTFPSRAQSVRVVYEHGYPVPPAGIKRAALLLAVETLVPTNVPARANYQVNQTGTYGLAVATGLAGAWYGIPEVDATLMRYRVCCPGIG
jgi:hypothetical protein